MATDGGERRVPGMQGRYHAFYEQFAAAVRGRGDSPVPAAQAIAVLEVIDAARESALSRQIVPLQ